MKFSKKITLIFACVVFLSQIPFVYHRLQIGQTAQKIEEMNAERSVLTTTGFKDYKGVIHVHTAIGGHSTGAFDELIEAANSNNLDFVMMTEHAEPLFDTSALTLKGVYGKTLFVNGQEVDTANCDRFLLLPGSKDSARDAKLETPQFIEKYKSQNKLVLVTYPEKLQSVNADFDGIEVLSLNTTAKKASPFSLVFDVIWSFGNYPEVTLARHFQRPNDNLQQYDELSKTRKISLFAGNDAHSNIGFHLFGDDAGNKFLSFKIDRYETIFRLMRTHILLDENEPLTQTTLLSALKNGRSFIAFDALGDAAGFNFTAQNGNEFSNQGDEIILQDKVLLKAQTPLNARFVVFKDGEKVYESQPVRQIEFEIKERGAYRVETYLDSLGSPFDSMPWIISNPIYVR
jgi:hypothetical protein